MRADVYLCTFGHTESRKRAQDLIAAGAVSIDGQLLKKSAVLINEGVPHEVEIRQTFPYVSRGGVKLEAALNVFGVNVNGKRAVDIGASTGGFTDCLLQRGARVVYSIDAGVGQLHPRLLEDTRVHSIEKFNARNLSPEITEGECEIAVADVSFISQTYIIEGIASVLCDGGVFVSLIKPQFEAGRQALGKGGIVTSGAYRYLAAKRVISFACEHGFDCRGFIRSPIEGGDGNLEYLALFVKKSCLVPSIDDKTIKRITS